MADLPRDKTVVAHCGARTACWRGRLSNCVRATHSELTAWRIALTTGGHGAFLSMSAERPSFQGGMRDNREGRARPAPPQSHPPTGKAGKPAEHTSEPQAHAK